MSVPIFRAIYSMLGEKFTLMVVLEVKSGDQQSRDVFFTA